MPKNINNRQVVSITNSRGVRIGNIENTVSDSSVVERDEISAAFAALYQYIAAQARGADKADAQRAAEALEAEARKGEEAEEKTVRKWFNFLLETLPDIVDVLVETFLNPVKGVSLVFQKVAKKARAGAGSKSKK